MRVNVYAEELTGEVLVTDAVPGEGRRYLGLRFVLASAPGLHHDPGDDDRSAVTLWFTGAGQAQALLTEAMTALEDL